MKEIRKEADRIINRFKGKHIILTTNSIGKKTSPYKSGYIEVSVMKEQAKQCALMCIDEKLSSLRMAVETFEIEAEIEFQESVKQYIIDNY